MKLIDADAAIEYLEKHKEMGARHGSILLANEDAIIKFLRNKCPTLTPQNEWVSVEERLPEDEARQYIEDVLDGIGYLYPCLLTYKSPNTERIHVVRFYYDIIQKWFVNNGEELCEKGRCIAWMPLPAPYNRRPPEGEA